MITFTCRWCRCSISECNPDCKCIELRMCEACQEDRVFRRVEPGETMVSPPSPDPFVGNSPWYSHAGGLEHIAAEEWALGWDERTSRWVPEYSDPPEWDDDDLGYLEFDIAARGVLERWETQYRNGRIRCTKRDVPTPALVLVGCGEAKRKAPSRACELYNSSLFAAHWKLAQRYGTAVRILSAEHHVLDPEQRIAPYNRSVKTMPARERSAWDQAIATWLLEHVEVGGQVVVLAGQDYVRWRSLVPEIQVLEPLARLPLGDRLQLAFPKDQP